MRQAADAGNEILNAWENIHMHGKKIVGAGAVAVDGVSILPIKTLWDGSWSTGDITVTGQAPYTHFDVRPEGSIATIHAIRVSSGIVAGEGAAPSGTTQLHYYFRATVVGDVWTLVACRSVNESTGAVTSLAVDYIKGTA